MSHSHLLHSSFLPTLPASLRRRASLPSPSRTARQPVHCKIREIFMPALSSTMTEGKIVSWVKSEGEKLNKGESVVVVESDKADMDVESFYDGYLAAIIVDEGLSAAVGSTIALLAETEEEIALAIAQSKKSDSVSAPVEAAKVFDEMPSPVVAAVSAPASRVLGSAVHPASEGGKRVVASPYAKKLAKELGVDLKGVAGSGPNGRVVAKDVEAAL